VRQDVSTVLFLRTLLTEDYAGSFREVRGQDFPFAKTPEELGKIGTPKGVVVIRKQSGIPLIRSMRRKITNETSEQIKMHCGAQKAPLQKSSLRAQGEFVPGQSSWATSWSQVGSIPQNSTRTSIVRKKLIVITLAVFAFGFGSVLRSIARTDMIESYGTLEPTYNYAPLLRVAQFYSGARQQSSQL
jgi:hypothetical protein